MAQTISDTKYTVEFIDDAKPGDVIANRYRFTEQRLGSETVAVSTLLVADYGDGKGVRSHLLSYSGKPGDISFDFDFDAKIDNAFGARLLTQWCDLTGSRLFKSHPTLR